MSKTLNSYLRKGHLYFGLFLFPWAILYGITAFLFNHPMAFSDAVITPVSFDRSLIVGTAMESLPGTQSIAEEVLEKLNKMQTPATPYTLAGPAKFNSRDNRSFAFATVKQESQTISLLIDIKTGSGTIRANPIIEQQDVEKAPFALGNKPKSEPNKKVATKEMAAVQTREAIQLDSLYQDKLKSSIPVILERSGFASHGEVTITSVPDLLFPISVNGQVWNANYNFLTGSLQGTKSANKPTTELGWRRFLLKLHTAHGYPYETNSHWYWALIVDAMAMALCFWGLTGLVMWWQLKSQRLIGLVILFLSAICATTLGIAMHVAMS